MKNAVLNKPLLDVVFMAPVDRVLVTRLGPTAILVQTAKMFGVTCNIHCSK